MKSSVELAHVCRLINHGPVTLVSSAHGGAANVMAAAWTMPLDFDPPKVAVVVDAKAYTRELIAASGEFALNIPCRAMAENVLRAGAISGRDTDKFAYARLATFPSEKIGAPLIEGCVAWLECRVMPRPDIEQWHDLFLAEVVAARADNRVFRNARWQFDDEQLRTLHYYGGKSFAVTGDTLTVAADPNDPNA